MGPIAIVPVRSASDELRALIDELDQTLAAEYRPDQQHGLAFDALFESHVRMFVARDAGVAVGCGGVAFFESFAEVKRMYVRDTARGRGVARALLAHIEAETAQAGVHVLRLETGTNQHAALRLYERAGFRRCAAFAHYVAMAPEAIATSIFMEKTSTHEWRPQ